jgi:hypothetical protein
MEDLMDDMMRRHSAGLGYTAYVRKRGLSHRYKLLSAENEIRVRLRSVTCPKSACASKKQGARSKEGLPHF